MSAKAQNLAPRVPFVLFAAAAILLAGPPVPADDTAEYAGSEACAEAGSDASSSAESTAFGQQRH